MTDFLCILHRCGFGLQPDRRRAAMSAVAAQRPCHSSRCCWAGETSLSGRSRCWQTCWRTLSRANPFCRVPICCCESGAFEHQPGVRCPGCALCTSCCRVYRSLGAQRFQNSLFRPAPVWAGGWAPPSRWRLCKNDHIMRSPSGKFAVCMCRVITVRDCAFCLLAGASMHESSCQIGCICEFGWRQHVGLLVIMCILYHDKRNHGRRKCWL